MIAATQLKAPTPTFRIRPVALPVEHGGWGLLLEPIVLGLILSPSIGGAWLSVAAIAAFLTRHPLKVAIGDWRRDRRSYRTALAERFAIVYFIVAILSFLTAIRTAGVNCLFPILLAAPFMLIQLFYDTSGRSRAPVAELAGSVSVGVVAAAIAIAGGWSSGPAFGLWIVITARNVPTILYVRAKLRLLHHRSASPGIAVIAHLFAAAIVGVLALNQIVPSLAFVAMLILLGRAVIGFGRSNTDLTPKTLGIYELCFGSMTVVAVIVGYAIGW